MSRKIYISDLREMVGDGIYRIGMIHYSPFHVDYGLGKSVEELLKTGYLVDDIQSPNYKDGQRYELLFNKKENKIFYSYYEEKSTLEQRIEKLEQENANLTYLLMIGGVI